MSASPAGSEVPLLERLEDAAAQRRLSAHTIRAYRRAWLKAITWATAHDLELAALPATAARELYDWLTRDRGPAHHLQTRAALQALYDLLEAKNPCADCAAPPFDPGKVEMRYHTADQLGRLLQALRARARRGGYFERLMSHLAEALYFTATRFHEIAELKSEGLVLSREGEVLAIRIRGKGGQFRELPVPSALSRSLREWDQFREAAKGVRLRGGGVEFAGSPLVFPGRGGEPFSNQAFNQHLRAACLEAQVPPITAHSLRHTAATLLLNERHANLRDVQALLGHKNLATTARYTHVDNERLRSIVGCLEIE